MLLFLLLIMRIDRAIGLLSVLGYRRILFFLLEKCFRILLLLGPSLVIILLRGSVSTILLEGSYIF